MEKRKLIDQLNSSTATDLFVRMRDLSKEEFIFRYTQTYYPSASLDSHSFIIFPAKQDTLPSPLEQLTVWHDIEIRLQTPSEEGYSRILEILNQPISWWSAQPGFKTLLKVLKLRPMKSLPTPNADSINKYFNVDQRRAIAAPLNDERPFMVIHGPRESGKTLVAAEIINRVSL